MAEVKKLNKYTYYDIDSHIWLISHIHINTSILNLRIFESIIQNSCLMRANTGKTLITNSISRRREKDMHDQPYQMQLINQA